MSEPPPTPAETTACMCENDQMSNSPYVPLLGRQKLLCSSKGVPPNEPGGYGLPRSRTQTLIPPSASRQAATEPPKPDPTTTPWKCSSATVYSPHALPSPAAR